jgi:D-aminopeptidase
MGSMNADRRRARALGLAPGILPTGPWNAITDVAGVRVGHFTLIEGEDVRTGVTAILPDGGNLYQGRVPAGLAVGNGFGKLAGATQIEELGEIETPIVLTNTLAVPRACEALIDWTLQQSGNEEVRTVNPVVGETNDGYLNNIRKRAITAGMVRQAIEQAASGPVAEGAVGAGTGTVCFGWKGGIGTSSRKLPVSLGGWTLGVLVQSNFGGALQMDGLPAGKELGRYYLKDQLEQDSPDGSIMIVLATDAPLSDRNLKRLARRALAGLARTGAALSDGSGDYTIALSSAEAVRRTPERRAQVWAYAELPNESMSPLFQAAIETTEEAIYNSLCMATSLTGHRGHTIEGLPLDRLRALIQKHKGSLGESHD